MREGIVFLPKCENSFFCSRHIISSEWVGVCSLGPAVSPGSLSTLVQLPVLTPKTGKGQGRTIKWTAQEYCIQHSLGQGNNGMRYGGLWSQTADRRIKKKHCQKLVLKINPQAQCWVSSLQRRAEQNIFFSKEPISSHRSLTWTRRLSARKHNGSWLLLLGTQPSQLHVGLLSNTVTPHSSQLSCYTHTSTRDQKFCFLSEFPVNHHRVLQTEG